MALFNQNWTTFGGDPVTGQTPAQMYVDGVPLSAEQEGAVYHAYKLFSDAVKFSAIPNGYHVQHRTYPDGTALRLESNGGVQRVFVYPPHKAKDAKRTHATILALPRKTASALTPDEGALGWFDATKHGGTTRLPVTADQQSGVEVFTPPSTPSNPVLINGWTPITVTSDGKACMVKIGPPGGVPGWSLGDGWVSYLHAPTGISISGVAGASAALTVNGVAVTLVNGLPTDVVAISRPHATQALVATKTKLYLLSIPSTVIDTQAVVASTTGTPPVPLPSVDFPTASILDMSHIVNSAEFTADGLTLLSCGPATLDPYAASDLVVRRETVMQDPVTGLFSFTGLVDLSTSEGATSTSADQDFAPANYSEYYQWSGAYPFYRQGVATVVAILKQRVLFTGYYFSNTTDEDSRGANPYFWQGYEGTRVLTDQWVDTVLTGNERARGGAGASTLHAYAVQNNQPLGATFTLSQNSVNGVKVTGITPITFTPGVVNTNPDWVTYTETAYSYQHDSASGQMFFAPVTNSVNATYEGAYVGRGTSSNYIFDSVADTLPSTASRSDLRLSNAVLYGSITSYTGMKPTGYVGNLYDFTLEYRTPMVLFTPTYTDTGSSVAAESRRVVYVNATTGWMVTFRMTKVSTGAPAVITETGSNMTCTVTFEVEVWRGGSRRVVYSESKLTGGSSAIDVSVDPFAFSLFPQQDTKSSAALDSTGYASGAQLRNVVSTNLCIALTFRPLIAPARYRVEPTTFYGMTVGNTQRDESFLVTADGKVHDLNTLLYFPDDLARNPSEIGIPGGATLPIATTELMLLPVK